VVDAGWYGQVEQAVEGFQVFAEQAVEAGYRLRRVVVAQPPEPVGAFANGQPADDFGLRRASSRPLSSARSALLDLAQHFPGAVFVRVADPR
jgi:hypothetical protein